MKLSWENYHHLFVLARFHPDDRPLLREMLLPAKEVHACVSYGDADHFKPEYRDFIKSVLRGETPMFPTISTPAKQNQYAYPTEGKWGSDCNDAPKQGERVIIEFHGQEIEAIFHDGKIWVSVKSICRNLGIADQPQCKKIKENPAFEERYNDIVVPSNGGAQRTFCLDLDALTLWLGSISASKVKVSIRPTLIRYQRECMTVLREHFFGPTKSSMPVVAQKPSSPPAITPPSPPMPMPFPDHPILASLDALRDDIVGWISWQDSLEARIFALEQERNQARQALHALPKPQALPPPRTVRSYLVERMSAVATKEGVPHQEVWNKLYREFRYRCGVDLTSRTKHQNKAPLDVATEMQLLGDLYDLCCFLWPAWDLPTTSLSSPA